MFARKTLLNHTYRNLHIIIPCAGFTRARGVYWGPPGFPLKHNRNVVIVPSTRINSIKPTRPSVSTRQNTGYGYLYLYLGTCEKRQSTLVSEYEYLSHTMWRFCNVSWTCLIKNTWFCQQWSVCAHFNENWD